MRSRKDGLKVIDDGIELASDLLDEPLELAPFYNHLRV